MFAVKAKFDGASIELPAEVRGAPPGDVIVVFTDGSSVSAERFAWTKAQEAAFSNVWDNPEDALYDSL
jgi:hypothetical protein